MTLAIIIVNTAVHAGIMYVLLTTPSPSQVYREMLYPYLEVPGLILKREGLGVLSVLTSGFLHGSLSHLFGNMFMLWFFGRKVEDLLGPLRFGLFYLLCLLTSGLVSVGARAALSPLEANIPGLGASGAITGVMGAYLFLYPGEKVLTLISVWIPALPRVSTGCYAPFPIPIWLPSWVYIVFQLLTNALMGQLAQDLARIFGYSFMEVNVFAHLGGGLGGLMLIYFFLPPEVLVDRRQSAGHSLTQ